MRVVLQRVREAAVRVDGRVVGAIGRGYLVLVGFRSGDAEATLSWAAERIVGLRLFPDEAGRMNLDLAAVGGGILVVSQFTLYGDVTRGRRPSFIEAAPPAEAVPLYERFLELLRGRAPGAVESGEFGAMMDVSLLNEGPVTLLLER